MQSRSFSAMLQELSDNYYNHLLSFQDFRLKRREILDQIDTYYNGADQNLASRVQTSNDSLDRTMSYSSVETVKDHRDNEN